jgi:peptide/nickel transport system substrate-binding protein
MKGWKWSDGKTVDAADLIFWLNMMKAERASFYGHVPYFGGWSFDGPGYEPTGQSLFATGAETNSGSYSNPTEDRLIAATRTTGSLAVFNEYATYTDEQLPVIWMPEAYAVQAVTSKLANVAFNALGGFTPE